MALILCIDDEPQLLELLTEVLTDAGHRALAACDARSGLAALLAQRPDLVLCDISLPDKTGLELVREIRAEHPDLATTPIVFLSALADRSQVIAGKAAGGDDYLVKPVDFDLMLATIDARLREVSRVSRQHETREEEARRRFLSVMRHEMRTPLHAILGYAQMLREAPHGPLGDPQYGDYVGEIDRGARRLLEMINTALELIEIMAGARSLSEEAFDPSDCVAAAVRAIAPIAHARGVSVDGPTRADPPDGRRGGAPLTLRADGGLLRQMLNQLLSNAVKFTPAGGSAQAFVECAPDGGVILGVTDDGVGMTEAEARSALGLFTQIDMSLSRKFEGAGLGLALAKEICALHGARLTIDSAPNQGATVRAHFPPDRCGAAV